MDVKVTMTRKAFNKLVRELKSPKEICKYLNETGRYLGRIVWIDVDDDPVYMVRDVQ